MTTRTKTRTDNYTPNHALELLGPRAVLIVSRHQELTAVRPLGAVLSARVEQFEATDRRVRELSAAARTNFEEKRLALAELRRLVRVWSHAFAADVPAFDPSKNDSRKTKAAHALIRDADTLTDLIRHEAAQLPYAADAVSELEAAAARARRACDAVTDVAVHLQQAQWAQRNAAAALHDDRVRRRALLRSSLGPTPPDSRLRGVARRGRDRATTDSV